MKPEHFSDQDFRRLLSELPAEPPADTLVDGAMDRVFAVARERRSSRNFWRKAQRTGALSALLTLTLGALLGLSFPALSTEALPVGFSWLRYALLGGLASVFLWQIDLMLTKQQ